MREPRKGRPGRTTLHETTGGFAIRRKVVREVAVAEVVLYDYKEIGQTEDGTQMLLTVEFRVDDEASDFDKKIAMDAALREVVRRTYPETEAA